jgi:tripartite-type tricarboxylate transporter receptor subunit TctC
MKKARHGSSSIWIGILGIAVIMAFPMGAAAAEKSKDYPNRPITIIVPGPAGGISDVGVRLMGESLRTSVSPWSS